MLTIFATTGQLFSNHYSFSPTDNHRDTNFNRNICSQVSLVWIHKFDRLVFKLYFTKYGPLKENKTSSVKLQYYYIAFTIVVTPC